ncbi:MAG: tryptophan 7-halogenase [Pseudomonadota bacterium]
MTSTVKRVVVLGRGAAAWLTALGLVKAFPHVALSVMVVVDGRAPGRGRVISTLPSARQLHRLLGLDERELITKTGAAFKIGARHDDWAGPGSSFIHGYGEIGVEFRGVPFYKYLVKRAIAGTPLLVEECALAAAAVKAERFGAPSQNPNSIYGTYTYGYHLEETAYTAFVRAKAVEAGVAVIEDAVLAGISRGGDGCIEALTLDDGRSVAGDMFVDCSETGALIERVAPRGVEDWSGWLGADRMLTARAVNSSLAPCTQTKAIAAGWMSRSPLQTGEGFAVCYNAQSLSDEKALEQASGFAGRQLEHISMEPLRAGRRHAFWVKNCIAVGASAVMLEPLHGTDLQIVQLGLSNLVSLFPLQRGEGVEAAEYNRLMAEHAIGLRDFVIAHYRLSGHPLTKLANAPMPDRLRYKLDTFASTGHLLIFDFESFEAPDWTSLLFGLGVAPTSIGLHFKLHLDAADPRGVEQMTQSIRTAVQSMPPQSEFLRMAKMTAQASA